MAIRVPLASSLCAIACCDSAPPTAIPLLQILTPLQKARMVGLNYPHFPDVLQIMRAIMRLPRDGSIR